MDTDPDKGTHVVAVTEAMVKAALAEMWRYDPVDPAQIDDVRMFDILNAALAQARIIVPIDDYSAILSELKG